MCIRDRKETLWRVARISDCEVLPCIPSPKVFEYRNKVEVPLAVRKGQVIAGFYEPYTHRVVPSEGCPLEHPAARNVVIGMLEQVRKRKYKVYDEKTGRGEVRHLVARVAPGTGECMAVLVSSVCLLYTSSPEYLVSMLDLIKNGVISGKIAKDILVIMIETGKDPRKIVKEQGLEQISDEESLIQVIDGVIAGHPSVVEEIKAGKEKAVGFLVGQVMKLTKGKANPAKVNIILKDKLLS